MNKEVRKSYLQSALNRKTDLEDLLYWCQQTPTGNTKIKLKRVGFVGGCLRRTVKVDNKFFASVLEEMIKKQDEKIDELLGG